MEAPASCPHRKCVLGSCAPAGLWREVAMMGTGAEARGGRASRHGGAGVTAEEVALEQRPPMSTGRLRVGLEPR